MPRKREYHALAILVPDGRVIVVGGEGQPGNEPSQSIIDAYKPPYLFRGLRPQILNLEKTDYRRGETVRFDIGRTNAPTAVVLQSTQAVTHMMNCGENRFLDLDFSQQGQSIEAIIPNDSLRSLPGWYLLWAMVDDIPSVARMVRILPGQPVVIITPPTAGFTGNPSSGCEPLTVQFTSTSSANTTNFNWQLPGGTPNSSTAQNPIVVYSTPGLYNVTLTVSNSAGSDTATQTNYVTVNPLTTASFTSSTNGAMVSFTNTSANATSYAWNFGDGGTSTQTNPSNSYANDGTYTVTLTATGPCGTATANQVVIVTTVGAGEPSWMESFRVFPNPAAENIVLEMDDPAFSPEAIRLLDAQGRVVHHWEGAFLTKTLSTAGLPSGIYFLEIQTRQQRFSQKIVLKN
jgi:PKD repeat protein